MPRPTLVIGVGGTGSWVLSWLKKDLVETHSSLEGLPVRLLLLDTAPNIAKVDYQDTLGGSYSEFIRLSDEEFIHLPSQSAGSLAATERINNGVINKDNNFSHFNAWFCGGYFPAASLNLAVGAAQFRQLGRLSLIQGLHMAGAADQVYQRIQTFMDQAAREVGGQRSIDVHVAGSFAGGTGSGIFLDVAWLARAIARKLNIKIFLLGFFAMPSVFGTNIERSAKAFCAWRELNRMMTIRPIEGNGFRLKWGTQADVIYDVNEVVYDHVYLIDPMRSGQRITASPTEGVFPAMAEAISFIMDTKAGDRYVQHILQNLANRKVQNPFKGRPTYSTFYTRAWKVPFHYYSSRYQHRLALEFLRRLLDVKTINCLTLPAICALSIACATRAMRAGASARFSPKSALMWATPTSSSCSIRFAPRPATSATPPSMISPALRSICWACTPACLRRLTVWLSSSRSINT